MLLFKEQFSLQVHWVFGCSIYSISLKILILKIESEWDYVKAAVDGSSYYKLPILQWATGNIGFHHVHHLSPRVPNYNLEKAHESTPPLQNVPTITLATSLKSLRFRLWDEKRKNFVSFREVKALAKKRVMVKVKPEL